MRLTIATIGTRPREDAFQPVANHYLERLAPYTPVETPNYRSEAAFTESVAALRARTAPTLVLLDSRGKTLSSEELARWIERRRDEGTQNLVFAIGPADGWSQGARSSLAPQPGNLLLSFGPMTLPHQLARVVLIEQLYRAFTILANHPYHSGH
jgi:23S rRNA (pseudouridine1915-N3)-methyltransferase